ncbi:MAG: hypothetical protein GY829_11565, partial [Gammaproteobacteria bacterium]|nr:hypothetical protein [Gammaproteobacteria bacterium]
QGLWGSFFSRKNGKAMTGLPSLPVPRVHLVAGEAVAAEDVSADALFNRVKQLHENKL